MSLTKPELDKNFTFFIFTTEEARDIMLKDMLVFNNEKLQVSITKDRGADNPSELLIITTLITNNLPQRKIQTFIIRAIKQLFGANNIVAISFGTNNHLHTNKQTGWCHI